MSRKLSLEQSRRAKGLTRRQLADLAGVGVMTIHRAEKRNGWPLNAAICKAVRLALGLAP